jgi:hypothetical protein
VSWRESAFGFRRVTAGAAGVVVPGMGASRAARWARRGTVADGAGDAAADNGAVATAGAAVPEGTAVAPVADTHVTARQWPDAGAGTGRKAPPLPLPNGGAPASATTAGWARGGTAGTGTGARRPAQPPVRHTAAGPPPAVRQGPAPRGTTGSAWPDSATRLRSGESSNGTAGGAAQPPAAPFWARSRRRSK